MCKCRKKIRKTKQFEEQIKVLQVKCTEMVQLELRKTLVNF